ncbi:MATE family efflux transporter [Coprobacillus sp. K06]|uniref:MATE family efflux transporter n=1 Tax=Coprobacillus sp. K06 TaxID=2718930 RepID=UPI001C8C6E3E|nr:MATE family efflux transporter [Coprobacillus sp. K06]MBX9164815.1 MATE family efflux transporter [Coprobacillus sp. K06]
MTQYESQYERMIKQPIPSLILTLALPTTISMLVTNIYNMADTYFVSTVGTSATGAVGIVFGLMAILQAFGFMFGHGAGANISRRLGAKRVEEARRFASTSFFGSLFFGALIAIIGLIFLNPLMYLMGSTSTILPYARAYAIFILIAAPAMTSSCVMNNILRYEGQASLAMIGLTSGSIINIFGDYLFMRIFHMGVTGAGLSTALSQYISAFILYSMYHKGKTQSCFKWQYVSLEKYVIGSIVAVGFPSLCRQGLNSISVMTLNFAAGIYGDESIAAMSVVSRISNLIFSVGVGIGQGFQPVSAFSYGAKRYDRLKQAFIFTVTLSTILLSIISVICLYFTKPLLLLFTQDSQVLSIAQLAMKFECIAIFFMAISIGANMLFQSIGRSVIATFLAALRSGLAFIPLVILLPHIWGITGLALSQPIADLCASIIPVPFIFSLFKELS